eukprot:CAMPEP_0178418616 /NCGR_PEP_ID=MMETSP0689_2-20121128/25182_1 /TAXON_ID=160604 /ORGANISM="Amphidinium massartii, Strain CS-259" /LENGTH=474 /DNA_ID=CAMNT_0020040019 /DNA_START=42 /DNA_END=1462 /DNA_ORIENTATION=-
MSTQNASNLARKYELLQQRGKQRTPLGQGDRPRPATTKADIDSLKEYYLQRLSRTAPQGATRGSSPLANDRAPLSGSCGGSLAQPSLRAQAQSPGPQRIQQPQPPPAAQTPDMEDLEVLCNNCYNLISTSDAPHCTGDPKDCPVAARFGSSSSAGKSSGQVAVLDIKLQKLRENIEVRLASANTNSRVNVMRHLTQLRYHIDTAAKWTPGCPELGSLSDHTVQQVKQLTAMSRVLEPAVYIFSKRIENVILQKERELRKVGSSKPAGEADPKVDPLRMDTRTSLASMGVPSALGSRGTDVNSIVGDLDSECGTNYVDTVVTQDAPGGTATDVGNLQEADDSLSLKNEDEQRRWFYSQCLQQKLACADQTRARRILISDLYCQVRKENVPMQNWKQWIKQQMPGEAGEGGGATASAAPSSAPSGNLRQGPGMAAASVAGVRERSPQVASRPGAAGPASQAARVASPLVGRIGANV